MSSWHNITVGNLGEIITGYTPPTKNTEYFGDKYPFITPTDIKLDSRTVQTERFLSQKGCEYNKNRLLPPNSVCVTCIASIGKICMTTVSSVTNQQINSIVVNQDKYDPYFVYYLLITKTDVIQSVANSATTPIVNKSTFASVDVCVPPLPTQRAIVNFLDRKTEQIDELIRIKERRIELLQEQRTALINQAVTKGLDPNVEMKPSGIEWIGEIPQHWKVINTKYLFRLVTEPAPKNNNCELLSIYTDIGVKPRKELEERGNRATTTDGYWLVKKGDFIVNKLLAWMGAIGLSNYEGVTSPAYDILRKSRPLNERFYEYLFRCGLYFTEFKKRSRGIMEVRLRLYFDQFGQIPLVFPPVHEQDKITDFLDRKTKQINELIATEQRKIELLKEYRQSLISEAVTGKIDVRNEG